MEDKEDAKVTILFIILGIVILSLCIIFRPPQKDLSDTKVGKTIKILDKKWDRWIEKNEEK